MLKSFEKTALNPSTLLAPVPTVLVSCRGLTPGETDKANLITLAWAGTICSEPPMVSISIRKSRFSHRQISETGEFVINLVNEDLVKITDFCGVKSGREIDKFAECGLNAMPAQGLQHAPALAESPVSLSCKVKQVLELGSHDCFIAEIIAVNVASELIDHKNSLRLDKARLVAYSHGEYYALGKLIGFYGYSVASPDVLARRMPPKPVNQKPKQKTLKSAAARKKFGKPKSK